DGKNKMLVINVLRSKLVARGCLPSSSTTSLTLSPVRRIQIPTPKQCLNPVNIFHSPAISRRIALRPELFLPFIIIFSPKCLQKP
ncbi:MAG: hypothetical protein LBH06_08455, partial [Rikenellaceae bacterium]|nr:hypothetical protein [Rikenellaceae bacterium]